MLCGECGKVRGRYGGGRGDVWGLWEGLGEVRRSVVKDESICEEGCGSVEKCCVGGVGKRGKTKKGLHGRKSSFFCTKSREDKNGLTCFMNYHLLSPLFRFSPPGISLSPPRRWYHPL